MAPSPPPAAELVHRLKSQPASVAEHVALLEGVPLFSGMDRQALGPLGACLQTRECASGELVCALGEPGETMYFIVSGEVEITLPGPDGGQIVLACLGPSNFFGELALIDGQLRSANATSTGASHLLVLSRGDFLDFLGNHRQALENLLLELSRRLREANRLLQEFAKTPPLGSHLVKPPASNGHAHQKNGARSPSTARP